MEAIALARQGLPPQSEATDGYPPPLDNASTGSFILPAYAPGAQLRPLARGQPPPPPLAAAAAPPMQYMTSQFFPDAVSLQFVIKPQQRTGPGAPSDPSAQETVPPLELVDTDRTSTQDFYEERIGIELRADGSDESDVDVGAAARPRPRAMGPVPRSTHHSARRRRGSSRRARERNANAGPAAAAAQSPRTGIRDDGTGGSGRVEAGRLGEESEGRECAPIGTRKQAESERVPEPGPGLSFRQALKAEVGSLTLTLTIIST